MKKFTAKHGILNAIEQAHISIECNPDIKQVAIERRSGISTILTRREVEIAHSIKSELNLIIFMTIKYLEQSDLPAEVAAQSIEDALAEYSYFRSRAH